MGNGSGYVREGDFARGHPRRDGRAMLAPFPPLVSHLIDIGSVPPREARGESLAAEAVVDARVGAASPCV